MLRRNGFGVVGPTRQTAPRPSLIYPSGCEDAAVLRRGELIEHFGFNVDDLRDVARREASEDV